MWELIESNKRRSFWLFVCLFLVLVVLGALIGEVLLPGARPLTGAGLWLGIGIAILFAAILGAVAYWAGDDIVMSVSKAILVTKEQHPQLYNVVEEMQIAAGLGRMPEVYIVVDDAMNAFATGIRPEKSAIAVTDGMVERLSRDELQGVIAHEMSHIVNRDVLFMSFAGVLLGSITMLSEGFLRGMFYSSGNGSRRGKLSGGGRSHPAVLLVAIVFAVLAPLLARIFYFAISRKREYLADATAVRLTRYPLGLASALEKINADPVDLEIYNRFTAPLFIVDPYVGLHQSQRSIIPVGSTHPPIEERVAILRALSGAGFRDYQGAYMKKKKEGELIPERMLREKTAVPLRPPSSGAGAPPEPTRKQKRRELGDLVMAEAGFLFLPCLCGLKMKVPPTLGASSVPCPRCGRILLLPSVTDGITHTGPEPAQQTVTAAAPLSYERKSEGWETFACDCGHPVQLSPLFRSRLIRCRGCGKDIEIRYSGTTR